MPAPKRETTRISGISYAKTDDGIELPVIDLSHPAFALDLSARELADLAVSSVRRLRRLERLPTFVHHLMARRSVLLRNAMGSRDSYYSGLDTYLLKIGATNLHHVRESWIDTLIASAIGPVSIRMRHVAASSLIAARIAKALPHDADDRPLMLLNISGGPASDSLNALILLNQEHPQRLPGRSVEVCVLDPDDVGPRFGSRSLEALSEPGGALHGIKASLTHHLYDWTNPADLAELINAAHENTAIIVSSEGGLFEYASDEVIVDNLRALAAHARPGLAMVGSYVCDDPPAREVKRFSRAAIRLFAEGEFDALIARAGWFVTETMANNPIYRVAAIAPAAGA